ncbi:MAG: VCBS repeat-containing protein [Myxococcales bacterium]|nr:VCBS repeat-containing protein [Myxococcales bacterium]
MRHLSVLGLVAGFLVLLPVAEAQALSRTVHVKTGVTSADQVSEVFVRIEGPHINYDQKYVPDPGDLQTLTVDEFGATVSRQVIRLTPGLSRGLDAVDTIHGGHTRRYTATFYERRGAKVVAFARHQWKAQMNLRGINECVDEMTIDPDQRIEYLHKRDDEAWNDPEFFGKLGLAMIPRAGVFGPLLTGDKVEIDKLLVAFVGGAILNRVLPGLGQFAAVEGIIVEKAIKKDPGTCLTHLWVMPSIPAAERTELRMLMPSGFGDARLTFVADFNGDGRPDVATARDHAVRVVASEGGHWREQVYPLPAAKWGGGRYNWAGDFDGDGKADIASAYRDTVILRPGGKGFKPEVHRVEPKWGDDAYTFAADFTGDGRTDLASAYKGTLYMKIATGSSFTSEAWPTTNAWGGAAYTWVGDFNGDGRPDIASARGDTVHMRLGRGDGFDYAAWRAPTLSWGSAGYTFVADFDGDGRSDIASCSGDRIFLLRSTGSSFTLRSTLVPAVWGGADYTFAADFTGDGKADIASARGGEIFLNRSVGTSFARSTWEVPDWWGGGGYTWAADLDGNGRADILTASGIQLRAKLSHPRVTGEN